MFDRRDKLHIGSRVLEFVWPTNGFRRAGTYLMHRLSRLPGTPYTLACGFACGAAASFTPFVGLHFVLAGLLAWVMRGNMLASAIGTAVGNPWTFPFIWVWLYYLGNWMGFGEPGLNVMELNFPRLFGQLAEALLNGHMGLALDIAKPVLAPMFFGSLPSAVIVWVVFYFPLRQIVKSYQRRRTDRRSRRKGQKSKGTA
ncbi:MAG: DUF2062 domain-containing protein [Rhodospirillales bacterium]|nr:DUF2062 domain-containing protein [Rhodospirillales bacterium]